MSGQEHQRANEQLFVAADRLAAGIALTPHAIRVRRCEKRDQFIEQEIERGCGRARLNGITDFAKHREVAGKIDELAKPPVDAGQRIAVGGGRPLAPQRQLHFARKRRERRPQVMRNRRRESNPAVVTYIEH
jgi:hypothetical protein